MKKMTKKLMKKLEAQTTILECRRCDRLVHYREQVAKHKVRRFLDWEYWGKPVPSLGGRDAQLLVIGLAPAAHGGNRTGRIFTGDRSGDWLFRALHRFGFANQPQSVKLGDGLRLIDCYVTATVHCAPPDNKPLPSEFANCQPYLLEELRGLRNVRVVVPLGSIGFRSYFTARKKLGWKNPVPRPGFGHGAAALMEEGTLVIPSYHPSQQNTQTRRLTEAMFDEVFHQAREHIGPA
jgi:uracil-DNA glycosylase family 4